MSFLYIGSKSRVVDAIMEYVGPPDGGCFVDAFSGTGVVAEAAAKMGWPVLVNDHLASSATMSLARLLSRDQVKFESLGGYREAVHALNQSFPRPGFIWREYSPASSSHHAVSRMYFTEQNAQRIDGMRSTIGEWSAIDLINDLEEKLLIADLICATNRIANTAGTYGCFLSSWQRQSLERISLVPRELKRQFRTARMSVRDALDVDCGPTDTVYLDPPYTKRQYAAYYHILETIAVGDEPAVEGVCGIRPWRQYASDYCYKMRAVEAIRRLVTEIPARRLFLSYSDQGHIPLETLGEVLQESGCVVRYNLDRIGRYRPNRAACRAGANVDEVLFFVQKMAQSCRLAA